jgi:hypothetical protein
MAEAKASGLGSMWGRVEAVSFTLSMSKRTAPGMCPSRNSASGSRPCAGRYQEPSTTTMSGASRRSKSHWAETKGWVTGVLLSVRLGEGDPHAAVLLALLLDVGDATAPISPVRRTWVPPQGWRSMPSIRTRRTRPAPRGGFTDMVFTRPGIGVELLVGDPALGDGRVAGDELVEALVSSALSRPSVRDVEVEPPVAVADGSARDGEGAGRR